MKVLLIHPPWLRFFGSCLASPPVALNYIAASVAANMPEVEIDVYNADYADGLVPPMANDLFTAGHEEYHRRLHDENDPVWGEIRKVIAENKPDVIGVSSMTATFTSAQKIIKIAREVCPACKTVLGGRHPTALPELSLKTTGADFVVIGDGEETFCELLSFLNEPEKVDGIAYVNSRGETVFTPPRVRKIAIDDYAMPIFESGISRYGFEDRSKSDYFTWSVLSARGCPFQCVYCATEHQVRFRSVENVMAEIRKVKNDYGITHFCFEDDTFSLKLDRMREICRELKAEKVKWTCVTRVDTLDDSIVEMMKDCGCTQVYLGIETGSAKTMARIRKNINIEQVQRALELFKKYDLPAMGFFIIGFHWEKFEDMKATIELIKKLPLDSFQLNIATPLPGTALFEELEESGKLLPEKVDWSQFHQGSLKMNFSDYPQEKWEKMLLFFQAKAFSILKKKYLRLMLRRFRNEPGIILKKAFDRIRSNPALLKWFFSGKKELKIPDKERNLHG